MEPFKISAEKGMTFDDILILPNYTEIKREEIDLSSRLTTKIRLAIPLISSPMDTVTESKMAIALGKLGGLGVIHRNLTVEEQKEEVKKTKKEISLVAAAVGVGTDLSVRLSALTKVGLDVVVVDSAHGFSKGVIEATSFIAKKYPNLALIAGNVATAAGAKALIEAGAQGLRVGMGPGSICTTRIIAGVGVPQVTAILETVAVGQKYGVPVIADGGVRTSGDIMKALSCGAETVMLGSLLAGCLEAPGKIVSFVRGKYKTYRGMGSVAAMQEGSAARYGQEYRRGQKKKLIAEGVEGFVPYQGTLSERVEFFLGGLRSGMYYVGAKNIPEIAKRARLISVTNAAVVESYPHDILLKEK